MTVRRFARLGGYELDVLVPSVQRLCKREPVTWAGFDFDEHDDNQVDDDDDDDDDDQTGRMKNCDHSQDR